MPEFLDSLLNQQAELTRSETIKECIGIAKYRYCGSQVIPQMSNTINDLERLLNPKENDQTL